MKKIKVGTAFPSAAFCLSRKQVKYYTTETQKSPEVGDVVFGEVISIGQHSEVQNKSGRLHRLYAGSKGIFVFGNRYAPDFFEGLIPDKFLFEVDMLARSGVVGLVKSKNLLKKDPTRIKLHGYVCDKNGLVINTKAHSLIKPTNMKKKPNRAKLILVCGTCMNSGKSVAATSICWALTTLGHNVRGSKITGTASLNDILQMNDAGAQYYSDFTYLGFPSTYLLPEEEVLSIFNLTDLKYANNPANYWVVEFADGINQRETAFLLNHPDVRSRIHKLVFCASDAFSAVGGIRTLKEKFDLTPDAISGICSSSPLHIKELSEFTNIPVFNSIQAKVSLLKNLLVEDAVMV